MNIILAALLVATNSLNSETVFYASGSRGPYKIIDNLIFVGTDSVFINDSLIDRANYSIDYNQGLIVFKEALGESVQVLVRYRKLPFSQTKIKYFNNVVKTETIADSTYAVIKEKNLKPETEEEQASDLNFSGSKTISVDLDSKQGLGLEQATRINLKGNLQGVDLSAVLSDVGNPIPPEGTTKELSEFDKIFIKLQTDKFVGSYGDNDLIQSFDGLGSINKKIIGVLLNGRLGNTTTNLGYAKSKGKYKKLIFYGLDNKQGPYYLTKDVKSAPIVAGSENVYLSGKRMIRGQTEDYTIDYSTGSVTFTNRQIINSFSRIEIDFEYSTEEYNRYLILANGKWQMTDGLILDGGFFSEADDKTQNLSYDLDDGDINYLATVFADSNQAWLSGVKNVGMGNGDYTKVDSHYMYAGLDSGDYNVRFTYVGTSLGNYDYDNVIGGFVYRGENQGKYVPQIHIQLPEQNRFYNANAVFQSAVGININLQGFLSQRKLNLFSNSNLEKNGLGYHLNSTFNKERFKMSYQRTEANPKFYFPGTYNSIDFDYNWAGIIQESLKNSDEINLKVKPFDLLVLDAGVGWLKSFNNQSRQKLSFGSKIMTASDYILADGNTEIYPNLGKRYYLNLTPKYKILYPRLELFWGKVKDTIERHITPALKLQYEDLFDVKIISDFKEFKSQNNKLNSVYKLEGNFCEADFNLTTIFGYQINKINNIEENANFFGNASGQFSLIRGLSFNYDYLDQQGEMQTTEINYVWVGNGQGNYRRNPDTGEFYFDAQGDFIQQLVPSGNYINSRIRKLQTNWDFYRFEFFNFDGYYSIHDEKSAHEPLQNINSRQFNLSILPYQKSLAIRLTNSYDLSKDNQYNAGATERRFNNNRLEIQSQLSEDISSKFSIEIKDNMIERINQGIEESSRVYLYTFSPSIGYSLDLKIDFSHSRQNMSRPLYYTFLGKFWLYKSKLALERNWEIRKSTNFNANFSLTHRTATISQLPYDINLYEPNGITPEIKINLDRILHPEASKTFNQVILSANYSFIKFPQRVIEQTFTVKIQANF
jgi:hypothetical protein